MTQTTGPQIHNNVSSCVLAVSITHWCVVHLSFRGAGFDGLFYTSFVPHVDAYYLFYSTVLVLTSRLTFF